MSRSARVAGRSLKLRSKKRNGYRRGGTRYLVLSEREYKENMMKMRQRRALHCSYVCNDFGSVAICGSSKREDCCICVVRNDS